MTTPYIREIVSYGSREAVKHWLKIKGFHPHTAVGEANFYKLLDKHIVDGTLRIDELRRVALEIEEYGGKRVYLGKLSNHKTIQLRQSFENHLRDVRLRIDQEPVKAKRLPDKPHLNYICWTQSEVRIGYSETHQLLKQNRETMTLEWVPQTNLIVISAEPASGAIKILMDAPGQKHPHQATYAGQEINGYVAFYKNKASELLGAGEFRPLNLLKVVAGISKLDPTIFEETEALERTAHNRKQRIWGSSDVRDDPSYAAGARVDGDRRVVEGVSGWWLPQGSEKKLDRKVWMHVSTKEDMVHFPAHNLACEVDYAISRIRKI